MALGLVLLDHLHDRSQVVAVRDDTLRSSPFWRGSFEERRCLVPATAFLLFLVQPVMAKQILPWFGGSAAVWTTCMVFFQLVLLLGYVYFHLAGEAYALVSIGLISFAAVATRPMMARALFALRPAL